jgi:hypothetical protein
METKISFPHLVPILRQINLVHNLPSDLLSILILSSHLRLRRSSSLFIYGFPTTSLDALFPPPPRATPPPPPPT